MKRLSNYKPYFILLFLVVVLLIVSISYRNINDRIIINNPTTLNESWIVNQQTINLPSSQDVPKNTPITITKVLPQDFSRARVILIRTSLQDIVVMLDDQVIYERNYNEEGQFPPYASMWHFIETPGHSED